MQQDLEDKRQEVIIENLENKIKEQSAAIEKKNLELQTTEGLLVDAEAKNNRIKFEASFPNRKF